ncbi:MAG: ribonuclease III [Candidatus Neomarinimicrobiota bacterium]
MRRLKGRLFARKSKLTRLQHKLGYFFSSSDLLVQSITHKSVHSDLRKNYEQLEFLGDAIIDYLVSKRLLQEFPESSEGLLTEKRSALVQKTFLAKMGDKLGLLPSISAAPSVDLDQEKVSQNQLANVFEAIVGAIYLDGGIKPCERLVETSIWNHRREAWRSINHKGLLIEYCQAKQMDAPRFLVTKTTGPEHQKVFEVSVQVGKKRFQPGNGKSKKAAEQQAAQIALESIGFWEPIPS